MYIKIQEHGLKFNQEAIEIFFKNINWDNTTDASEVYAAFFGGLVANERVKQTGKVWTYEDVCDWVDTLTLGEKESVMECMGETQKYKESLKLFQDRLHTIIAEATHETAIDKKKVRKVK